MIFFSVSTSFYGLCQMLKRCGFLCYALKGLIFKLILLRFLSSSNDLKFVLGC